MRVSGIIHQQICQLKWHLLACLGLIMVLPVEEAIIDLRAGDSHMGSGMTSLAVMFGPLLSGLIACANVQGDLNEKRYIFWRSKPANVKLLISLKFFIGLVASLLVIACPVVFAILCSIIWDSEGFDRFVPLSVLIAIMTYSLCFACNVVVRKTARAWLIGMLLTGFVLVTPFMLPLGYTDIISDIDVAAFGFYPTFILIATAAAFVFALYAVRYDWHLRTNLKGLLWVAAGLVFILTMLFSSQVTNIKVLEEKGIQSTYGSFELKLDKIEDRLTLGGQSYIDINNNNISLTDICEVPTRGMANIPQLYLDIDNKIIFPDIRNIPTRGTDHIPRIAWLRTKRYPSPWHGSLYKKAGDDVFFLTIHAYYQKTFNKKFHMKDFYRKVYLRSYRLGGDSRIPVSEIDLSDFLTEETTILRVGMRLINNTLVAFLNDSYVMVDVTDPGELKQTDRKFNVLKTPQESYQNRLKEFTLPLLPVEGLSIEERIKLSIDWNYQFRFSGNGLYNASIVDIHDGKIAFVLVSKKDIARFDVTRWDREKIYCKFRASRPFTIIEGIIGEYSFEQVFVKNGNLYCLGGNQLMVFDIRSRDRIRKLGHFVRMDYCFDDIEVLDNGNILLIVQPLQVLPVKSSHEKKRYLYLLENPE
jgi:hypothetical protein